MLEKVKKLKMIHIVYIFIFLLIIILLVTIIILFNKPNSKIKTTISSYDYNTLSIENFEYTLDVATDSLNITNGGSYLVSGSVTSKCIYVNAKGQNVTIGLNNVNIENDGPCIYVSEARKVYITIIDNSINTLKSTGTTSIYNSALDVYNEGCIYSKDNLSINGTGILNIDNAYSDGIKVNDLLIMVDATLNINAVGHGINSNEGTELSNANITIVSTKDGIHSENNDDLDKNYISILSGNYKIITSADGISASGTLGILEGNFDIDAKTSTIGANSARGLKSDNLIIIRGGILNIISNDQGIKSYGTLNIFGGNITVDGKKGLKAETKVYINGGVIDITSSYDGINSTSEIEILSGDVSISATDDGLHADDRILIKGGNINITKSYEGIESYEVIIKGGKTLVKATDDGINVNCPEVGIGGMGGMMPGQTSTATSSESSIGILKITGGYLFVNAGGDGLDSNNKIRITGGVTIVDGPTDSGNGSLDFASTCKVTGGVLIACGSSGMAQNVTGGQCSIMINFDTTNSAKTTFGFFDKNNKLIFAYTPNKKYQSIVVSSNKLKMYKTYNVYTNISIDGDSFNGYYTEGTITNSGKLYTTYKQTSKQMTLGNTGGMGMGPR